MKYVIVVDMQKDFVDGPLGSPLARVAASNIRAALEKMDKENTTIIFTQDTHYENYLETMEGKKLPVPHCVLGTEGWEIVNDVLIGAQGLLLPPDLEPFCHKGRVYKNTFGSLDLINLLYAIDDLSMDDPIEEIIFMGVCTDICVISNVLLVKAAFPEIPIKVVAECCAGVSPESHQNALNAMKQCHIDIV